jgi:hypothetical protein
MAHTDPALEAALALLDPGWTPPDTSEWMRQQHAAELVDIEPDRPGQPVVLDDDEDDFAVDDRL